MLKKAALIIVASVCVLVGAHHLMQRNGEFIYANAHPRMYELLIGYWWPFLAVTDRSWYNSYTLMTRRFALSSKRRELEEQLEQVKNNNAPRPILVKLRQAIEDVEVKEYWARLEADEAFKAYEANKFASMTPAEIQTYKDERQARVSATIQAYRDRK